MKDDPESVEMERQSQVSSFWLIEEPSDGLQRQLSDPSRSNSKATTVEGQVFQKQELMLHRIFPCLGDSLTITPTFFNL